KSESEDAIIKGLKKSVLRSLPKHTFNNNSNSNGDCSICLTEFVEGDEIRVLPQCGHGFHVGCIDTWLGSHSSWPSCCQILVVARSNCNKCGGRVPASSSTSQGDCGDVDLEVGLKRREDDPHRFLP
ncbi:hypothetical protein GIB67_019675, partial [Kingdonia uniflora]